MTTHCLLTATVHKRLLSWVRFGSDSPRLESHHDTTLLPDLPRSQMNTEVEIAPSVRSKHFSTSQSYWSTSQSRFSSFSIICSITGSLTFCSSSTSSIGSVISHLFLCIIRNLAIDYHIAFSCALSKIILDDRSI